MGPALVHAHNGTVGMAQAQQRVVAQLMTQTVKMKVLDFRRRHFWIMFIVTVIVA